MIQDHYPRIIIRCLDCISREYSDATMKLKPTCEIWRCISLDLQLQLLELAIELACTCRQAAVDASLMILHTFAK